MSLCVAVSEIAKSTMNQLDNISQRHLRLFELLIKMPEYSEHGKLADWDAEYKSRIAGDEDELHPDFQILEICYELAIHNLYGRFDSKGTKVLLRHTVESLARRKINIKGEYDVSSW